MSEPDGKGAARDEMVEDLPSLGSAVLLELNPVGLAATDGVGKLPQRITRSAAGVH